MSTLAQMMRQATNLLLVEHKARGASEIHSLQVISLHQLTPLCSQLLEDLPRGMLRTQRSMHDQLSAASGCSSFDSATQEGLQQHACLHSLLLQFPKRKCKCVRQPSL